MPTVDGTGQFKTPGPAPALSDRESFWRRHFVPPSAFGIVAIVLVSAVLAGFLGAAVWAANDNEQLRVPEAPPPPVTVASDETEVSTTTTRPDLTLESIDKKLRPMVWSVKTLDAAGQPTLGSAFSAGKTEGRTLLLTSLAVVEAATRAPGPPITVEGEGFSGPATLWTWDENTDLALLVITKGSLPALPWVAPNVGVRPGDKVFAVSAGGVTPGVVAAASESSLQHNIFIDDQARGAPLVNVKGEVLAISSVAFVGAGEATDTAFFGPPILRACESVLSCPGFENAAAPPEEGATATSTGATTTTTEP
jgi:S1-C subfamily serine protease